MDDVTVYWCVTPPMKPNQMNYPTLMYLEPKRSIHNLLDINFSDDVESAYNKCPAFVSHLKNVYSLQFPFNYGLEFDWKNSGCRSTWLDQEAFDDHIQIRSWESKLFSLRFPYVFFCEEDLILESTSAYTADNDFVNKTVEIPGNMNINKWFRPVDATFRVKKGVDKLEINRGDDFSHISFRTDKKVKLQRFFCTERIMHLMNQCVQSREYKKLDVKMDYYYDLFESSGVRKLIVKEIKENLL